MATVYRLKARPKLAARPKPAADAAAIRAEVTEQYAKTLEYLGS